MPEPSPAYLWYPKDILSSGRVAALSDLEELWYRRALDHSWLADGLPADPAEFAGWIGRGCTVEAAEKIIGKFFVEHRKDLLKVANKRQERERTKYFQKCRERSKAGIESGRKRRELSKLKAEQTFDFVRTKPEQNRTIPISFPIPIPISDFDLKRLIERAVEKNSTKDSRLVEIAVIQTLVNRNGSTDPINSIEYFTPEIKQMCSKSNGISADFVDAILQRRREQMEKHLRGELVGAI